MKISFSSIDQLNRWEAFRFLHDVVAFTDNHSEGMSELFNTKFEVFRTAFNAFDDALVQEQKVAPEGLVAAEEGRDMDIRKIYSLIREYSQFPYEQKKEDAANAILNLFKPYGTGSSISIMAQDEETSVLINLLQDFDTNLAASTGIETLGLTSVLDSLRMNNAQFVHKQQERTKSEAHLVLGLVKDTRTKAQEEFISFTQLVNALGIVEGEEKYASLKLEINKLHKNVVDRAKQRATKREEDKKKQEEREPNK